MNKWFRGLLLAALLCALSPLAAPAARAQDTQPDAPTYEIQPGDTLYLIAIKFDVSVADLVQANQLANPDILTTGTQLVIPGLEGIEGLLATESIQLGQNLTSLSRFYQVPIDQLNRLNRLTSPAEVYTGANLIIPMAERVALSPGGSLTAGTSLLEYAALHQTSPWQISALNAAAAPSELITAEPLYLASADGQASAGSSLEPLVTTLELSPLPLIQGSTAVVRLVTAQVLEIHGTLNGKELNFFADSENQFVAIQGIHAMAEPGLAEFSLEVKTQDGLTRSYQQMLLLQDGYYQKDEPLAVDPATLDKAITGPEDDLIRETTITATPQRAWSGIFRLPVDEPYCIKSWYGNRRSYNASGYNYFHTGLDYGVCANLNIYAPAPGVVVYTGPLTVRGNATIIDHGWGIYSGFWHQAEILVKTGQTVQAGDLVGLIGGTGRVTGPHLHWEVWANGVQVNPQEWLDRAIP
jgi:murein DD-endopeptidase MepM/ murein hydrolase activator NlpD